MVNRLLVLLVEHDGDQLVSEVQKALLLVSLERDLLLNHLKRLEEVCDVFQEEPRIRLVRADLLRSDRALWPC